MILVNIYAPNDANQQVTFFKELENQLEDFAQENMIIAADFNCALSENDKKGGNPVWKKSIVFKEVQHLANLYNLQTFGAIAIRTTTASLGETNR